MEIESRQVKRLEAFAARESEGASSFNTRPRAALSPLAAFAATQPTVDVSAPTISSSQLTPESPHHVSATSDELGNSRTQVASESINTDASRVVKEEADAKSGQQSQSSTELKLGLDAEQSESTQPLELNDPDSAKKAGEAESDKPGEQSQDKAVDAEEDDLFEDSSEGEGQLHNTNNANESDDEGGHEMDALYGDNSGKNAQSMPRNSPQVASTRFCLPKTSDIELFHCVLVRDATRLEEILSELSPNEVLGIRDSDQRTVYHYGSLCTNRAIQSAVFDHINSYNERQLANRIEAIMQEQKVVEKLISKSDTRKREWVPPSVKELTHKSIEVKQHDWEAICRCLDRDKRSILHYMAAASKRLIFEDDPHFTEVIRAKSDIVCARDVDGNMPLHIAVEVGNIHAIKWYFSRGLQIQQQDVSALLRLNRLKHIQDIILHQLEHRDARVYYAQQRGATDCESRSDWDLGLGVLARVELERVQAGVRDGNWTMLLLDAAKYGHLQSAELLLHQGVSPAVSDSNGWTALHVCADEGTEHHIEIARLLLDPPHSVFIDTKSLKGRTPLHLAAKPRHRGDNGSGEEMIRVLCRYGAAVDTQDRKGNTPLHLACRSNNVGALGTLAKAGCNMTAVDNNGRNGLHLAALQGNSEIICYLLSWEEGVGSLSDAGDNRGRKPIEVARNEQTRQLLVNKWSLYYRGNVGSLKQHLVRSAKAERSTGAVPDNSFVSETTVQTMRTPLHLAIQGYFNSVQPSRQPKPRSMRRDPIRDRYLQLVLLLLRAGADPDATDKWGITPIMIAAAIDDEQLLEALLYSQMSSKRLRDADQAGNTALHYSYAFCNAQNSSILEDAMEEGEEEEEPTNNNGQTPLETTGLRDRVFPADFRAYLQACQRSGGKNPSSTDGSARLRPGKA